MNALLAEGLFVLSVVMLYLVFKYGYKKVILEHHRRKLFEYRAMLYGLVQKGKINPNHPAYRHVEEHLNSILRYAHWTTTSRILFSMFVMNMGWYEPKRYRNYLEGIPETDGLPKDLQNRLTNIKEESFNQITKFLPKYSPTWFIVRLLIQGSAKLKRTYTKGNKDLDKKVISKEYDLAQYNEQKGSMISQLSF